MHSLTLISTTGGGLAAFPPFRAFRLLLRVMKAKSDVERADADLACHFSKRYLWGRASGVTRRDTLRAQYIQNFGRDSRQTKAGEKGQAYACLHHKLYDEEVEAIREQGEGAGRRGGSGHAPAQPCLHAGFPVTVVHGKHDAIARWRSGLRLAIALEATFVLHSSGHFLPIEHAPELNAHLLGLARSAWKGQGEEREAPASSPTHTDASTIELALLK